jgi:hypothetical protein
VQSSRLVDEFAEASLMMGLALLGLHGEPDLCRAAGRLRLWWDMSHEGSKRRRKEGGRVVVDDDRENEKLASFLKHLLTDVCARERNGDLPQCVRAALDEAIPGWRTPGECGFCAQAEM